MKQKKSLIKIISHCLFIPLANVYVAKRRTIKIKNIKLVVKPGVFHPTLYFSTKYLLAWLTKQLLKNRSLLELGAGSGLLSIYASKQNAIVTATDISENAYKNIQENAINNAVCLTTFKSDLFTNIPLQSFDLIVINPPYYPKSANKESEYAWYCGENFEYFHKLFFQMKQYMKKESNAIMVLSEDCNIEIIKSLALKNGYTWQLIEEKKIWWEMNYIFEIKLQPLR